ncbi:glycosyltransferase family 2 protein [Vibrio vulnificus]|uniref:glycosyltransferase family 2 protein n=1 Tax=Vibrio vulnificus TaxID=672 RepID=UPI00163CA51D|nr:glycosyltransferase family 2 protein [Vibrio vulnificus]EHK9055082.1 glycosyltransferase family 2 protein [Vibrio vulnificus]ELP4436351.1 glycosyltransferase family 2 protein [Vibrio vulnificus]QND99894.1 glycosyltransferase family 2 protein [Vibrio vulnificus]
MKVSIITPAYNAENYIFKTYNFIRQQTHMDWEWLVTDDQSTDNTLSILNDLSKSDIRVRVYTNSKNSGAALSRNNSIKYVSGEFVAFLDSDDTWLPSKLSKQIEFMEKNSVDFSFTAYELISEDGNSLGKNVDTHLTEPVSYEEMLRKKATLGCSTVMIRRSAFDDISMPLIRTGQDYGLWLKLLKTGAKAYPLPEVLTQYRILPNSISRNKLKKAKRQWQIYREIEKLNLLKSFECFFFYAWRAVFRK